MRTFAAALSRSRDEVRRRTPPLVRSVVHEVRTDDVLQQAAATAFFAVLSLFPALLLLSGLVGLIDPLTDADLSGRVRDRVTDALNAVLTDEASGVVDSVRSFLDGDQGGLLTAAALGALVSVSGAWAGLVGALNRAYDTGEDRSWFRRRVVGLGLGLATILIVVVTAVLALVGPLLGRGPELADLFGLGEVFVATWTYLRWPVLVSMLVVWLLVVYRYGPNRTAPWRAGLPGALWTTAGWLAATGGFHVYVRTAGDSNVVIGAFGGAAVVMLWLYLLILTLLVGGELNAVLERRRAEPS